MLSLRNLEINELSHRRAMGLHEYYTPTRVSILREAIDELRSESVPALVSMVEDREAALVRRFAAGTLLALLGDPRIDTLAPRMIDVPGGVAVNGLDACQVDEVVSRYRELGVRKEWIDKECPVHEVELAAFRIGRYPITNIEYRRFLEETQWEELPTSWALGAFPTDRANHPVYTVSARGADAYAEWLSARTGRRFRLPTEAEWEYVAAGSQRREYPWGNEFEVQRTNTVELGILQTTPVGMFPRGDTPTGVSDLGGNVEEYVADIYRAYPGGEVVRDDLLDLDPDYRVAAAAALRDSRTSLGVDVDTASWIARSTPSAFAWWKSSILFIIQRVTMNTDERWMMQALDIAKTARRSVSPRPWVGAAVVSGDRVWRGATTGQRGPHAEVVALDKAGEAARGATLYVTLEPCSHFGVTPPCAHRVVEAGIRRCVVALRDPDERVSGQGLAYLRNAGVEVEVGVMEDAAARQLAPYLMPSPYEASVRRAQDGCIPRWPNRGAGLVQSLDYRRTGSTRRASPPRRQRCDRGGRRNGATG